MEVTVLNGAPGVYSARYAGETCSYEENNRKLLSELTGVEERSAQFRTVLALSNPNGEVHTVEGVCTGKIVESLRGKEGFGYDPLFIPTGFERTFAEMSADEKNRISHRAKALKKAREVWLSILKVEK